MKNLWIILIIGVVLRVVLSLSTFHPDMLAFKLGGEVVASGKILDLYDYSNKDVAILNYPPPIYWFHGIFNFLFGSVLRVGPLVKIPYLIFDLLIGFLLYKQVCCLHNKLFTVKREAILAFALWMFNPISIYATYMMGQFDIIPTFFTILSVYLIARNKLSWASVALGAGIAFKLYPIFLLIPLIALGKTFWDKLRLAGLAMLPYILSIIPYLPSANFRVNALFTNQSSKSLYAGIPVSGGELILLFPGALILFYLFIWAKRLDKLYYWRIYLILLLLFFIFTHFHPQWLSWVTPFLILDIIYLKLKNLLSIFIIFSTWFGSLFFFDPSLTVGIFAPLIPTLQNMPDIWTQLGITMDYNLSRSMLQTIFAAASFYLIYYHFPRKNNA